MPLQAIIRTTLSVLVLFVFLLHSSQKILIQPLQQLENWFYDLHLNLSLENTIDPRVVIIDVDEKSLFEQGHWPWPRNKLAMLVNRLFDEYQIRVLGFDMVFAEPDRSSGLEILNSLAVDQLKNNSGFSTILEKLRPELEYDQLFAQSLSGRKVASGFYFKNQIKLGHQLNVHQLPPGNVRVDRHTLARLNIPKPKGYTANLPVLQKNSVATGFFDNPTLDSDGVFRRISLLQAYNGEIYESLSLAILRLALDLPQPEIHIARGAEGIGKYFALEYIKLGSAFIPVDAESAALVPYRGQSGSFPYLSATDVIEGRVDAEQLFNRIVLLGTSAPGLSDLRNTPVQKSYPGVEVHANMISGILDGRLKHQPAYLIGYEVLLLILITITMTLITPLLTPFRAVVLVLGLIVIVVVITAAAWHWLNLVLPIASTITLLIILFGMHMFYGFFIEAKKKRQLAQMFSEYVPPELVDEMNNNPENYSLLAEDKELTVLFSDVRGFTGIAESQSAQELSALINEFLTPMTRIIHQHRGTIDKYMGDAIMAFWGAPMNEPEHARYALTAAFNMIEEMEPTNLKFAERGWPKIRIGIGLNSGPMIVGNMGSEFRRAYTVMGDAVNLGSRLEGLTKLYGVPILVSENIVAAASDFTYQQLDCVRVKGREKAIRIYQPLGIKNTVMESVLDEAQLFKRAYRLYTAQKWDDAEMQFHVLSQRHPAKKLYTLYQNRIIHFRQYPPEASWDGVFSHTKK